MSKADEAAGAQGAGAPDLSFKMCKKIAQLTKVVHHLHSQTELHQKAIREVAVHYENVIDEVILFYFH